MMKQEMASEMIRSRSHTESTMARDGKDKAGSLLRTVLGSTCPGICFLILYGLAFRGEIASPWVQPVRSN